MFVLGFAVKKITVAVRLNNRQPLRLDVRDALVKPRSSSNLESSEWD